MRRLVALAALTACSACAAVAGLSDYEAADCVGSECTPSADTGSWEAPLPASDSAPQFDVTDDVSPTVDSDVAPACTPIVAKTIAIGAWSIDATEVTNAQYAEFLAAKGADTSGQPKECGWNSSYRPTAGWPAPVDRCNHPVVQVDWCDALAYCKWAGKRLCGNPSGGSTSYPAFNMASASQWFAACSRGGASRFAYGATYTTGACVDDAYDGKPGLASSDVSRHVTEATGCHGSSPPHDALFDMNGNVAEWEDSCTGRMGPNDDCRIRGGSYLAGADRCDCDEGAARRRAQAADDVGIRCCSL
jgi:formylglycine-generating enzyme required for sulfatase activity